MHLLFFAHKTEALSFINKGQTRRFKWDKLTCYQTENYIACLTGTPTKLPTNLSDYPITHIFNLGTCAATNHTFQLGQIIIPDIITNQDYQQEDNIVLLTTEHPYQANMHLQADLVDMEAFAIQNFAQSQQLPFTCIKIISDFGDSTKPQVKQIATKLSEQLYQYYVRTCHSPS